MTKREIQTWEYRQKVLFNKISLENWKIKILKESGFDFKIGKNFLSFEEARTFVWGLKLNGQSEWIEYCTSGNCPSNIPHSPEYYYKNGGWISWGDFLGTTPGHKKSDWMPYKEAETFVHTLGLTSARAWDMYCKTHTLPFNLPQYPQNIYEGKGWVSWGKWLGTERIADNLRKYLPFHKARSIVHSLKFERMCEYRKWWKTNKPINIPAAPWKTYKERGYKNSYDWLGTIRKQVLIARANRGWENRNEE